MQLVCVWGGVHTCSFMWKVRDNFVEWISPTIMLVLRNRIQAIRVVPQVL